jgi:hypothetical protein
MTPEPSPPAPPFPVEAVVLVTLLSGAVGTALALSLPDDLRALALPAWAAVAVFGTFFVILMVRVGGNLFGEIGFLYLAVVLAYTLLPAAAFMVLGLKDDDPLGQLLPAAPDLGAHLWRHALFMAGVAAGYLLARGREVPERILVPRNERLDHRTIVALVTILVVVSVFLTLMSAPVETYWDNYTRFDHLSWLPRKLVSIAVRLKLGLYTLVVTFLFLNYRRYRRLIPVAVVAICAHEMIYTHGSRIESLIILIGVASLFSLTVKPITLKMAAVTFVAVTALFTVVELVRLPDGGLADADVKPAAEFGAVFFTGFHLYQERAQGTLPPREWPMFFSDVIGLVTTGDFSRWNPQDWYTRNYYPDAEIAPMTLGPIADSAIWGGEPDLLARGLLNGLFFAYIVRWFLKRKEKWWAIAVYVYCVSSSVLTLKYSIFFHLVPLLKTLTPTLLLIGLLRMRLSRDGTRGSDDAAEPSLP